MIATLSVVVVALAFTGAARAQEKTKPKHHELTGEITVIDAKAGTLSVKKADDAKVDLTVGAKCKIAKGAEKAAIADLKVGDKVTVTYIEGKTGDIATRIELHLAKVKVAAPVVTTPAPPAAPAPPKVQ
jgi:membrane protein implicated in regulation of membrane protease activity